ncbi:hypothetical protein MSPP1_002178 [Malassezia sp. CBS 17886]|nr:hypothetical protein MSPP1_002178 [Malassezia sp. CBS 17886]
MIGPSVSIALAEPAVFMRTQRPHETQPLGEHDDATAPPQLRGTVTLSLPRPARIKDIVLTLTGTVRTDWPEGLGPSRIEMTEQIPVVHLKTSIFRSQSGLPVAVDTVAAASCPEPTPLADTPSATRTRLDEMDRAHVPGVTALMPRISTAPVARRFALKGILDGLRMPQRAGDAAGSETPGTSAAAASGSRAEWFELRRGEYQYPFSISLPADLPPTLHADFGHLEYLLCATVTRSGPLTPNLVNQREVTLVQMPAAADATDPDLCVVTRTCEDMLSYMVSVGGRSFAIGTSIPVSLRFVPTDKIRVHRITVALEEQTDYFANERHTVRREVPRKWTMLRLCASGMGIPSCPLLPLPADGSASLHASPLAPHVERAAELDPAQADAICVAPFDPRGPWDLALDLEVSMSQQKKVNISCQHPRSNISVTHVLKLTIRVERGDDVCADAATRASQDTTLFPHTSPRLPSAAQPKQRRTVDIVIGIPITLTHSHTSLEWTSLPRYESTPFQPAPPALFAPTHALHVPLPPPCDSVYTALVDPPPATPYPEQAPPPFASVAT